VYILPLVNYLNVTLESFDLYLDDHESLKES